MPENIPTVSVIVPCLNEEATIQRLLEALILQTYPLEKMEVVIMDGHSTDNTRKVIADFQKMHPELALQVFDNPVRTIPSSLNQAIHHTKGRTIIRLDAHSVPNSEYIERCVAALKNERGENVGGVWQIQPGDQTWIADCIAAAASHALGAGDAQYRLNASAGPVDTVPFGAFRRELIDRIGPFNESLLTNEDYEFNARLRRAGGKVWLDPSIQSVYYSRSNLSQLARQYARYGFWKWRMLLRFPATLRWRQALPPLFTLILLLLTVLSLWFKSALLALADLSGVYIAILGLAGLKLAIQRHKAYFLAGFPMAIAIMHLSWGGGFLWSIIAGRFLIPKNG